MTDLAKAGAAIAIGAVGLRVLVEKHPDEKVDLSPDTRPEFSPDSLAPLASFDIDPCGGSGGIGGALGAAGITAELVGRFVDKNLVPYSHNAALTAQGRVLGARFGFVPRLLCNGVACMEFLGGDTPNMDARCARAVADEWISHVERIKGRPEISAESAEPGLFASVAIGVLSVFVPNGVAPSRGELEGLSRSLDIKAAGLEALSGEVLRRRVQEIWGLCSRIATRLDAALNLKGHERVTLSAELADRSKEVAGEVALAGVSAAAKAGGFVFGAAADAFLSEFGGFIVFGGLVYLVARRAMK